MGKYAIRSIKYFFKLMVLLALLIVLMLYTNKSSLDPDDFFAVAFSRYQTWLLLAVVVVWSILYPKVEFVKRRTIGNLHDDKMSIINALRVGGMTLASEDNDRLVFHGEASLRRLWWLYEDVLILTQDGDEIVIEGPRRFAGEAQNRIPVYIQAEREKGDR